MSVGKQLDLVLGGLHGADIFIAAGWAWWSIAGILKWSFIEPCCHEGSGVGLQLSPSGLCCFSFSQTCTWLAREKRRFSPFAIFKCKTRDKEVLS